MKALLEKRLLELNEIVSLESTNLLNKKRNIKHEKGSVAFLIDYLEIFKDSIFNLNDSLVKKSNEIIQDIKKDFPTKGKECKDFLFEYCKNLILEFKNTHFS